MKDNENAAVALSRAINNYPEIFFVKDSAKCGSEIAYAPFPLSTGDFACGLVAYNEAHSKGIVAASEAKPSKPSNSDANLAAATIPALIGVVVGICVATFIFKKLKPLYETKFQRALLVMLVFSLGYGTADVVNELVGSPLQGLQIRTDKVLQNVIANLTILPAVLWGILFLSNRKKKEQKVSERATDRQETDQKVTSNKQKETENFSQDSLHFWEQALAEYEGETRNKGLWAKLYSEFNGNENSVKAQYISVRAQQLEKKSKEKV